MLSRTTYRLDFAQPGTLFNPQTMTTHAYSGRSSGYMEAHPGTSDGFSAAPGKSMSSLKVTVLGCGGSGGVPLIGGPDGRGDLGACDVVRAFGDEDGARCVFVEIAAADAAVCVEELGVLVGLGSWFRWCVGG